MPLSGGEVPGIATRPLQPPGKSSPKESHSHSFMPVFGEKVSLKCRSRLPTHDSPAASSQETDIMKAPQRPTAVRFSFQDNVL